MVCKQLCCWQKRCCTCCAQQNRSAQLQHDDSYHLEHSDDAPQSSSKKLRTKQKQPATSVPPLLKRRLGDGLLCVAFSALSKHTFGLLFTMIVLIVIIVFAPIVVLIKIYTTLRNRFTHQPFIQHNRCDAWWPIRGNVPFRAVITTQSMLDQNLIYLQLSRIFMNQENARCSCDVYRDFEQTTPGPDVRIWDQQKTRLKVVSDLVSTLDDTSSSVLAHIHSPSFVFIVPNFANTAHGESYCSLAIFSHDSYSFTFCLPRLLSLYSDGQLIFDVEPKMGESFSPHHAELNIMFTLCQTLAQTIQFTCVGPLSVALMYFRRTNPIWSQLINESEATFPNRRKSLITESGDETVPMEDMNAKDKCDKRLYRWMRVSYGDHLLRAERILRAATVELFLAFVAGALRRHFRASGIPHPPDIGATVPVSYREYVPVEAQKRCDMILLPLQIPCGVEGVIPRVWAVQRRLAGALDGVLPNALRVSRFLSEISLSDQLTRQLFSSLYGDNSAIVSVFRASGDVQMDSQRIQSILFYPSLPESVKAAFTFVQCGTDIMLSVSVNALCFPEPDKLLVHFKTEIRCLLDQLSMRLLTLSQATFLPSRVPSIRSSTTEPTTADVVLNFEQSPDIFVDENIDVENCSVEQLELLLRNVQSELEKMRNSPQTDRAEYVSKLNELENRMRIFHETIAARLGTPACSPVRESAELASSAVADLLAPYKQENASTTRRFSREFMRIDIPRKSSRVE